MSTPVGKHSPVAFAQDIAVLKGMEIPENQIRVIQSNGELEGAANLLRSCTPGGDNQRDIVTLLKAEHTVSQIESYLSDGLLKAMALSLRETSPSDLLADKEVADITGSNPLNFDAASAGKEKPDLSRVLGREPTDDQLRIMDAIMKLKPKDYPNYESFQGLVSGCDSSADVTYLLTQVHKSIEDDAKAIEEMLASRKPAGLFNVGNSCWFNSTIQVLFNSESLYRRALTTQANREIPEYDGDDGEVLGNLAKQRAWKERASSLLEIITFANTAELSRKNNVQLYRNLDKFIKGLYFESALLEGYGHQEDAHVGLISLISYLGLDEVEVPQLLTSAVAMSLEDDSMGDVECQEAVPLILRHEGDIEKARSVQELINRATMSTEELTPENRYAFDNGEKRTLRASFLSVDPENLPKDIVLEVPRFYTSHGGLVRHKDFSPIRFDPNIEIPCYNAKGEIERVLQLELRGVICHRGDLKTDDAGEDQSFGHYVAYKYSGRGERPYTYFNDQKAGGTYRPDSIAYKDERGVRYTTEEWIAQTGYLATYHVTEDKAPNRAYESVADIRRKTLPRDGARSASPKSDDWKDAESGGESDGEEYHTPPSSPIRPSTPVDRDGAGAPLLLPSEG